MILIVSSSEDLSTDYVIEWLYQYNKKFYRINFYELLSPDTKVFYSLQENLLQINSDIIDLNTINAVWLRKLGSYKRSDFYRSSQAMISQDLLDQNGVEFGTFIMSILKNINSNAYWLTNLKHIGQSKWQVLRKAIEAGLTIPQTYFVNNKHDLTKIRNGNSLINKTINDPYFFSKGGNYYTMYTKELDNNCMGDIPDRFMLSVIQNKIEKEFEIRTFFLEEEYYSMAIVSQNDPGTSIDFRNYNSILPNRNIPFKLPLEIERKLTALFKSIDLNCGSVDLIKDKNGDYIFLEVNPHGQFGMLTGPCNYNLYNLIAKKLIEEDEKR